MLLTVAFGVVLFTVLMQGITIDSLAQRLGLVTASGQGDRPVNAGDAAEES